LGIDEVPEIDITSLQNFEDYFDFDQKKSARLAFRAMRKYLKLE